MVKFLSTLGIAALLLTSCQKEVMPETEDRAAVSRINFRGEYNSVQVKTTLTGLITSWQSLDKVGIYSTQAMDSLGVIGVKNMEFTALSDALNSEFSGSMYWATGPHTFYAYYPYNAANSSAEATAIPISLTETQTQNGSSYAQIGTEDFMVATPRTIDPGTEGPPPTVDLLYNHVFSMIECKVLIPLGTTKFRKIEITTSSANNLSLTLASIDITQAKPAADAPYTISGATGSKTMTLDITGDCTITNDISSTTGAMMMVLPGNHTGSTFTVNAYTDLGITTVIRNGVDLKRNNKYNLTISIPYIDLKTAGRFGILAYSTITNTGMSEVHDMDVGLYPGTSITGFFEMDGGPGQIFNGSFYRKNDGEDPMLIQARQDLSDAYDFAEASITPTPVIVSGDLGDVTLYPGIYKSTSVLSIQSGDLTLDAQGNPNAFWVFQIASDFTTTGGAGGSVLLTGGAQAKNVFWQVGNSATIGDNTSFKGIILALTSVTMNSGATLEGRMLARNGSVILTSTNMINKP